MTPTAPYARALQRLSRRELLATAWQLGAAAVAVAGATSRVLARPAFRHDPFSLGVASGDPLPAGLTLWTRLAPEPLAGGGMPMSNVEVGWELAHDEQFRRIAHKGVALARPELGHSVHVDIDGLEPGREYWYRFHVGRATSMIGRSVTAPAADAAVSQLRFAVCGCSRYDVGFFTAYRHLANERFDFVFHTGDYIYENRAYRAQNPNLVREHHGLEIFTLVDYRNRYAQYKSDPDLRAAHASAPFVMSWDDHEVDNDYAGDVDERETPAAIFLLRRAAAYQAYFEHMPLRAAALPNGSHLQLYRRLRFGQLLDLSVLDTRQYRSDQACGHGAATNCAAALDDGRSLLGAAQERWLFEQIPDMRSTWTVLGQQVPAFARDFGPDVPAEMRFSMDKWDGYAPTRRRLFAALQAAKAPNPILLSGDVHQHFGADLKLDFTRPDSPTIGAEFTNSSISSAGDGSDVAANWETLRRYNPHIHFHSNRRGYIACTATPQSMRADFKVLDRVTVPGAPARLGGSLVAVAGTPGVTRP